MRLREREQSNIEPDELEFWLGLIDALRTQHPQVAFVVLNCLPPSHCWRANGRLIVRFARHHGLSLQDAICLAQIADALFGVLDLFGLAAHSAGRPGIPVALENGNPSGEEGAPAIAKGSQIMVGSRDHAGDRNGARPLRGNITAGLRSAPPEIGLRPGAEAVLRASLPQTRVSSNAHM